jgi:hypothetical protein
MKTKIMRALSIEIGPDSYPRWPVPVVKAPVAPVWVAEHESRPECLGFPHPQPAHCTHGLLIASGAVHCRSLPLICHYMSAAPVLPV